MHGQLFENHTGCEAAQNIHAKHSFDLSEVQFEVPAPEIEFFQLMGRIKLRIEQQVNGVENMLYMSSVSAMDGTMQLTVTFKLGTDPNGAKIRHI